MKRSHNFREFRSAVANRLWEIATGDMSSTVTEIPTARLDQFRGHSNSFFALKGEKGLFVPKVWYEGVRHRRTSLQNTLTDSSNNETIKSLLVQDLWNDLDNACHVVLTLWSATKSCFPNQKWVANQRALVDSAIAWLPSCGPSQDFIPFLKYQLSWLFAWAEKQSELPERPSGLYWKDGIVLLGYLGKFMKLKCLGTSLKRKMWRNTILHGIKKGLPQMGPSLLSAAAAGLKKALTDFKTSPDRALAEISRTSREVFGKGIREKDWRQAPKAWTGLSGNACYENSRAKAGAIGHLRWLDQVAEGTREEQDGFLSSSRLGFDQFRGMVYFPRREQTKSIYFPGWTFEDVYRRERDRALSEPTHGKAEVSLILEPLKCRPISAGDIHSNCLYSDLQKRMWKSLQRFPQFQLTGRWVTEQDLMEIDSDSQLFGDFKMWNSGDYSQATNKLHGDATTAAATACGGDELTRRVLLRGLTDTEISFDKLREKGEFEVPENFRMTRGQLMGCVFSFPLLCVINCAMYRWALEERIGRKLKISELPVRINGDDILFKTDHELYKIWSDKIVQVGFEKSVGKNYVSEDFAIINSVYFSTTVKDSIRYVPYFNLGWVTGMSKGSGDDSEKGVDSIRSQMDEIDKYFHPFQELKDCVSAFKSQVYQWNEDRIKSSCLPLDRGPMGLNLSDNCETVGVLDEFRYWLLDNPADSTSKGIKADPRTMAPWKVTFSGTSIRDYRKLYREFWRERRLRLAWRDLPFAPRTSALFESKEQWGGILRQIRREIRSGLSEFFDGKVSLGVLCS